MSKPAPGADTSSYDAYTGATNAGSTWDDAPAMPATAYPGASANPFNAGVNDPFAGETQEEWDTTIEDTEDRSAWAAATEAPGATGTADPVVLDFTETTASPQGPPAGSGSRQAPAPAAAVPAGNTPAEKAGWYQIAAYRCYFDVDTREVLSRVLSTFTVKRDFFNEVEAKPDLYGPFWITTTAVFMMAMVANMLSWLHHNQSSDKAWSYDVEKVATCAGIMYGYVFAVGGLLWAYLKLLNRAEISLFSLWCIYGYTMAVWIPVTVISIVPNDTFSWVLLATATLYSAIFLVVNLRQPVVESLGTSSQQGATLLAIFLCHLAVGLALKVLVFTYTTDDAVYDPVMFPDTAPGGVLDAALSDDGGINPAVSGGN